MEFWDFLSHAILRQPKQKAWERDGDQKREEVWERWRDKERRAPSDGSVVALASEVWAAAAWKSPIT